MFLASLRLYWLRGWKAVLGLLAVSLAALVLCAALVYAAGAYFSGAGFGGVTLAVADEEQNPQLELLLGVLGGDEGVKGYASLVSVEPGQAEAMVRSGEATAALVLPRGFLNSVMTGENLAPVLILNANKPLEAFLVTSVAQSAVDMLAGAQSGIGLVGAAQAGGGDGALTAAEANRGINLEYARFALGRSGMYRSVTVNPTGSLPLLPHYLLGAMLFFALLAGPLLYPVLGRGQMAGWARRLQSAGAPLWVDGLAAVVFTFFAMLLGLCALLAAPVLAAGLLGEQAGFGLPLAAGVVLCAWFLALVAYLCCNLGSAFAAVGGSFFLALAMLYLAGGIVPPVLLPQGIARLSGYSPLGWMRAALAPLYGYDIDPKALGLLAGLNGVLLVACLLAAGKRRRA